MPALEQGQLNMIVRIAYLVVCWGLAAGVMGERLDFRVDKLHPNLVKRNPVQADLSFKDIYYVTEALIGSTRDVVRLAVDTTSSDMFVMSSQSVCEDKDCGFGTFNVSASNTFKRNDTAGLFFATNPLLNNPTGNGYWGYDVVRIGDTIINDMPFAIVEEAGNDMGVLGIGFKELEVTNMPGYFGHKLDDSFDNEDYYYTYDNVPLKFNSTGTTKTVAYSLYLTNHTGSAGSVLFGGIDRAKFHGELQTVDIVNTLNLENPIRLDITVDEISNDEFKVSDAFNATISTMSSLSSVPEKVLKKLASELDLKQDDFGYQIDCDVDKDAKIEISIGDAKIQIPLTHLVVQPEVYEEIIESDLSDEDDDTCYFGIVESGNLSVLGHNFLRNAYVVVDLEHYKVSLAPIRYTDKEDIHAIVGQVASTTGVDDVNSTLNSNTPMENEESESNSESSSDYSTGSSTSTGSSSTGSSSTGSSTGSSSDSSSSISSSSDDDSSSDLGVILYPSFLLTGMAVAAWTFCSN